MRFLKVMMIWLGLFFFGSLSTKNLGKSLLNTDTFDQQLLDLVNQERAKVGVDSLQINEQLDQAADLHSQDQALMDRMTHDGSNGSSAGDRIDATGYEWSRWAENVSQVALDAETVMFGGQGFEDII